MRFIKSILHPSFGISIFSINHKYLVKFEKSDCEISFKIAEEEFTSIEDLEKKILEESFLMKISNHFKELSLIGFNL